MKSAARIYAADSICGRQYLQQTVFAADSICSRSSPRRDGNHAGGKICHTFYQLEKMLQILRLILPSPLFRFIPVRPPYGVYQVCDAQFKLLL